MAYLNVPAEILTYDGSAYNFYDPIARILGGVGELEILHFTWRPVFVTDREHDQSTPFHKRFYKYFGEVEPVYKKFLEEVVRIQFDEPIVYQKVPTLRIQFLNNVGVGERHKDSDYSHDTNEINFVLPLTSMSDTTAIQTEHGPLNVDVGELLIFDGANTEHWNEVNLEGYTRVSLDFRVIPKSKFKPSANKSINTGLKMDIGGYYAELS